jgi:S1-C subfamily serine protease
VPVDTVNRIVPQLIERGQVVRPRLAVSFGSPQINQFITQRLGVQGLLIVRVQPGSTAEHAGLRGTVQANGRIIPGDVILKIDGRPVTNPQEFYTALGRKNVGDQVTLTVFRDGQTLDVPVTLEGDTQGEQ